MPRGELGFHQVPWKDEMAVWLLGMCTWLFFLPMGLCMLHSTNWWFQRSLAGSHRSSWFFSGFLVWLLVNRWALNLPFSWQKRCNHLTCYQVFKNCLGQGCYMISRPLARECSYTHLSRTSNKPKMRLTVSHLKAWPHGWHVFAIAEAISKNLCLWLC